MSVETASRPQPAPAGVAAVEVSVVMPCLDEAAAVGGCVRQALAALAAMGASGEVVVADNGSTDGSPALAAAGGARVVREPRRGYGAALQRGFREARGAYLVMGDADSSYDFAELAPLVAPLRAGTADLVMGSRLRGSIHPGAMPWSHRWIGTPLLSLLLRLLFGARISDSQCGLRAMTREAWSRLGLRTTGMEFASEMLVAALREKLRIVEVPITYHPRAGDSKLESFSDAWRHVRFMLIYSPSYLFQAPGIALMAAGAALMALLAGGPRELFGRMWDYHPLLFGALAFILGYNLVLFDVCAKAFSMGAGLAHPRRWLSAFRGWFSLEKGLLLGGAAFLAGLGVEVKILVDWLRAGEGPLMAVRGVVLGMTAMVAGAQTLFASFLVSLLLLERAE